MSYNAIYRARAAASGGTLDVFVPQVFGDVPIKVTESVGGKVTGMGWVMFQGGDPAYPVWLPDVGLGSGDGGGGGGGSATDDEVFIGPEPPGLEYELWYDTDAVNVGGGGVAQVAYTHSQTVAAATWVINHFLGWYPNATVIDSAGDVVDGDIQYTSANTITLKFSGAFSGNAYLS